MKRSAFTLLELLLVLALISAMAGIGVAGYQRMHARSEFKSGVVMLQIDLNRTRLLAMRTGEAYFFRFIPGTGIYEIAPLHTLQEAIYRMTDDSSDDVDGALGGTLSTSGYSSGYDGGYSSGLASANTVGYGAGIGTNGYQSYDPYGYNSSVFLLSDNLFSDENIAADLQAAAQTNLAERRNPNATNLLGGSLSGTPGGLAGTTGMIGGVVGTTGLSGTTGALGGSSLTTSGYGLADATNSYLTPYADGTGVGGQFTLGSPLVLGEQQSVPSITIREMNTVERPLGNDKNTIAWRVNLDGLVVRKEATGGVVFTFSRLSDSTPTTLKSKRPRGVKGEETSGTDAFGEVGEDLGSRLGGSLLAPPEATGSDALGGGLTAATSGIALEQSGLFQTTDSAPTSSLWSEPILFFPNGRTSTVAIGLANTGKYQYYSEIGVRGMTGYARISSITPVPAGYYVGDSVLTEEQLFRLSNPGMAYSGSEVDAAMQGGALGGALGSAAASPTTGGSLGGALDGTQTDMTTGLATSGLDAGIASGFTPGYGSTERRSGYSFNSTGTDTTTTGAQQAGVGVNVGVDDSLGMTNPPANGTTAGSSAFGDATGGTNGSGAAMIDTIGGSDSSGLGGGVGANIGLGGGMDANASDDADANANNTNNNANNAANRNARGGGR